MTTSPTLKTLLTGQLAGTAKTSPRKARCGWASAVELANSPGTCSTPAVARAPGSAGITPPLTAITSRFIAPPAAASHR